MDYSRGDGVLMSRLTATGKVEQPGGVWLTIAFTMDLDDWTKLVKQLDESPTRDHFPSYSIRDITRAMVSELKDKVEMKEEEKVEEF